MTRVAGEVADGMNTHGFTTPAYVRDITIPELQVGFEHAGRTRSEIEISVPVMFAIADHHDDPRLAAMRSTISFYGSTPAYRPVLDHHGWGALGDELVATAQERTSYGRNGIYDVTVHRNTPDGPEVVAEFRGRSRTVGQIKR